MKEWLVGCEAATSSVRRVFDQKALIAVVFYVRDRARFACTTQAHEVLALLHKARQGAK
jgi:hypothetical protein